jgi:biopolymer transport protein TolR
MGVSIESGGGGGRKGVNAELNLIPFIDLLSVCILFLLMTAVWVQISKMSAFSQPSGQATIQHSEVSSITEAKEHRDFDILIRKQGVEVLSNGKSLGQFKLATIHDTVVALKPVFLKVANAKMSLRAADDVIYEDVIKVLDALFTEKFTNITIGGLS